MAYEGLPLDRDKAQASTSHASPSSDSLPQSLVVRFASPDQVKLTAAGKALVNREAARIAWDEDSSKLVPDAAGAGCD